MAKPLGGRDSQAECPDAHSQQVAKVPAPSRHGPTCLLFSCRTQLFPFKTQPKAFLISLKDIVSSPAWSSCLPGQEVRAEARAGQFVWLLTSGPYPLRGSTAGRLNRKGG